MPRVAKVLHHEDMGVDFDGEYDVELDYRLLEGGYFHSWLFDLEAGTAKEIEGVDVALTQRHNTIVVEDRILMLAIDPEFTHTTVYEISEDAVATRLLK